jgi:hypothetical protein
MGEGSGRVGVRRDGRKRNRKLQILNVILWHSTYLKIPKPNTGTGKITPYGSHHANA